MYVIYVSSFKKKLLLSSILVIICIFSVLVTQFIINKRLIFFVTINNYIKFSYPLNYQVDNIFVNSNLPDSALQTYCNNFKKPPTHKFSSYKSLKGNFSFEYPSAFNIEEKDFTGGEILYHVEFSDKRQVARGFVEVWNLNQSLEKFLKNSKDTSMLTYKYFKTKKVNINGSKGYLWDYYVLSGNRYFKGMEVFFESNKKMYRISYFVPENNWSKLQENIFRNVVDSFKILQ